MQRCHKGDVIARSKGYDVIQCTECGFIHINPVPTKEDLEKTYPDKYWQEEKPDWIEKTLKEAEYWGQAYDDRYDVLERFLAEDKRRILDIGSFIGLFLKKGQERGWNILGIEPSQKAANFANERGVNTLKGFYEDFTDEELGKFDAVNLALTLEHVVDPIAILEKTYNILNPGGIVSIEVPNDFSPLQTAAREALDKPIYWLAPPHHINYFHFNSLSRVLERAGFTVIHKTATFPMEFFLMMGDDYLGNDLVGRICHEKRMRFEMNLKKGDSSEFRRELYIFFAEKGIGREALLYGRK